MNLDINGKYALIGGGSQGLGLAIAQQLATLGATCILVARSEENLRQAVSDLSASPHQQHTYLVADYGDYEHTANTISAYVAQHPVHILINNTGGPPAGDIVSATPTQFLKAFEQHLICNQLITQAVLPGMETAGYGRIINIISTSVKIPIAGLGVSNTIRGAVASWAKTLSNEVARYGITVNNILPGATETERLSSLIADRAKKTGLPEGEVSKRMKDEIPARRFGKPEEVAALAAFLASPAAAYINGTSIPVDGGKTGLI